jgi:methionyl-tRNA synthetase
MNKKFYVTTPIYYASGDPHIGHAFSTIYADVINRYKKMLGYETFFVTGMDEHGQKILDEANKNNKSPQKFVDEISIKFKNL